MRHQLAAFPLAILLFALSPLASGNESCPEVFGGSDPAPDMASPESRIRDSAYYDAVLDELRLIETGKQPPNLLSTRVHRTTLDFLIRGFDRLLADGECDVWDGDRKLLPYRHWRRKIAPGTLRLLEESRRKLAAMSRQDYASRTELIYEGILYTALHSSARSLFETQNFAYFKALSPKEMELALARHRLDLMLDSGKVSRTELMHWMKTTPPISYFFNTRSFGFPSSIDFDEMGLLRFWGKRLRPFAVTEELAFGDGRVAGYSPFEYARHDNGHGLDQETQMEIDGLELSRSFSEKIIERLYQIEARDSFRYRASLAVSFYILREIAVPIRSLTDWATGITVKAARAGFELPGDTAKVADAVYDKISTLHNMPIDLGSRNEALTHLIEATEAFKTWILGQKLPLLEKPMKITHTYVSPWTVQKIVTGGQTGVDRAAMDVAIETGLPYGGWCPRGRLAEDGPIDPKYPLVETPSEIVAQRTEWNLRDSDGTLILSWGPVTAGTLLNYEYADRHNKPIYLIDMMNESIDLDQLFFWIRKHNVRILNVAGPRQSLQPRAYSEAKKILTELFTLITKDMAFISGQ